MLARRVPEAAETKAWEQVVQSVSGPPIGGVFADTPDEKWLDATKYLFDSRRIQRSATFAEYALQDFTPGRPILLCAQLSPNESTASLNTIRRNICEYVTV